MKKGRHRLQGFIAGLLVMLLLLPLGAALGSPDASVTRQISVIYRNIQIVVNGERITPRDAQGRIVEPFIFEGTTFLPVRAVSEALGMTVDWDGPTSTVYVGGRPVVPSPIPTPPPPPPSPQPSPTPPPPTLEGPFLQMVPPYEMSRDVRVVNSVMMGGNMYGPSLRFSFLFSVAALSSMHNLDGQYSTLSGYIGRVDGTSVRSAAINFIGDGILLDSFAIDANDLPRHISVNVSGVRQLRIEVVHPISAASPEFAFANAWIE